MKRVCAWCRAEWSDPTDTDDETLVSHTICQSCAENLKAEAQEPGESGLVLMDCSELLGDKSK